MQKCALETVNRLKWRIHPPFFVPQDGKTAEDLAHSEQHELIISLLGKLKKVKTSISFYWNAVWQKPVSQTLVTLGLFLARRCGATCLHREGGRFWVPSFIFIYFILLLDTKIIKRSGFIFFFFKESNTICQYFSFGFHVSAEHEHMTGETVKTVVSCICWAN